jgi:hypothetical protein
MTTDDAKATSSGKTAEEFAALADSLRGRVDMIGKVLAGIGTVGAGAIGLAKVGDLAPVQQGEWPLVILAIVSLGTAALAVVALAVRLMEVNEPVILDADIGIADLSADAQRDVASIYRSSARRFGFTSLLGLEERETGLRKAAVRATSETERARRTALAMEVSDAIELAVARYVLAVLGLLVFALSADVATSDRTDAIASAKACAEAREAGATEDDLKGSICKPATTDDEGPSEPPTAGEARAQLAADLNDVLKSCTSLADEDATTDKRPLSTVDCDKIAAAVQALLNK